MLFKKKTSVTSAELTALSKLVQALTEEKESLIAEQKRTESELHEVERQRDVFLKQRDSFEAETKRLYAGHTAMEEEINFWKFRHAETSMLHEQVVERNWAGDRSRGAYTCSHPFERIEILPRGEVYTCCSGAVKSGYSIGNIYTDDFDQMWNCDKVKKLRYSVTKGQFEYCLDHCMWLANRDRLDDREILHPVQKKDGRVYPYTCWQDCTVLSMPKFVTLGCDETCNLQCLSCRSSKRALNREASQKVLKMLTEKVRPILENCSWLEMLSTGEVFASFACCEFLKTLNREEFPNLKLSFITNAQLFTRSKWAELKNIWEVPMLFYISMDAAKAATYEKLRLGAKWDILCENMKLISELRRHGNLINLTLNFVVQEENYQQMQAFTELGKRWGANAVRFQLLTNWGTNTDEEYREKNVFDEKNPCRKEAVEILTRLVHETRGITVLQNILNV